MSLLTDSVHACKLKLFLFKLHAFSANPRVNLPFIMALKASNDKQLFIPTIQTTAKSNSYFKNICGKYMTYGITQKGIKP